MNKAFLLTAIQTKDIVITLLDLVVEVTMIQTIDPLDEDLLVEDPQVVDQVDLEETSLAICPIT